MTLQSGNMNVVSRSSKRTNNKRPGHWSFCGVYIFLFLLHVEITRLRDTVDRVFGIYIDLKQWNVTRCRPPPPPPARPPLTKMVIVFRGTETTKEWVENATVLMEQLDGEEPESGFALFWNHKVSFSCVFWFTRLFCEIVGHLFCVKCAAPTVGVPPVLPFSCLSCRYY